MLNGEFYIFGGYHVINDAYDGPDPYDQKHSFAKIVNCGIEFIGELSIEFYIGSCGTFLFPDQRIFLCFGDRSRKKCHR